jgi:hypothetical protein
MLLILAYVTVVDVARIAAYHRSEPTPRIVSVSLVDRVRSGSADIIDGPDFGRRREQLGVAAGDRAVDASHHDVGIGIEAADVGECRVASYSTRDREVQSLTVVPVRVEGILQALERRLKLSRRVQTQRVRALDLLEKSDLSCSGKERGSLDIFPRPEHLVVLGPVLDRLVEAALGDLVSGRLGRVVKEWPRRHERQALQCRTVLLVGPVPDVAVNLEGRTEEVAAVDALVWQI